MEKRIIRAASIQSLGFLIICAFAAILIQGGFDSSVRADVANVVNQEELSSNPNYIYVIDPGHGGIDSGTLAFDSVCEEKAINLAVAKLVKQMLEQDKGTKVYMTRETDKFLSPEERIKFMNEVNPDKIVSIHCNSADNREATGVEILFNKEDEGSKELAQSCLEQIIKSTNQVDRGLLKGNNIYIIREAKAPIALVEVGFLSNQGEMNFLLQKENQVKIAEGIVNGIRNTERE